ncbi:MAG: hypothetical protein AAB227_08275 [Pseudomonadota bacterium]
MKKAVFIGVLSAGVMAFCAASAAKPGDHRGGPKDRSGRSEQADGGANIKVSVNLGDRERRIVRDYYGSNCPPGLAKKNNGCLPPGIAKKRYEVGRRIPDGWGYVPNELVIRLPRLGHDRGYRLVDGDIVVVAIATLIVLDALDVY